MLLEWHSIKTDWTFYSTSALISYRLGHCIHSDSGINHEQFSLTAYQHEIHKNVKLHRDNVKMILLHNGLKYDAESD